MITSAETLSSDLRRTDFKAGTTRETFWKAIETRFNDESLTYFQSFDGSVPEANSAATPLCYRPLDVLKRQFQLARSAFTTAHANYEASGQNDGEKWSEFLRRDRNGGLTTVSKRCWIIFVVCRLGQEFGHETFLLTASKKTFDCGSDEGPQASESNVSSGSKRKRRSVDANAAKMDDQWDRLGKFMEDTQEQGVRIEESITKQRRGPEEFLEEIEKDSLLSLVTTLHNRYKEVERNDGIQH